MRLRATETTLAVKDADDRGYRRTEGIVLVNAPAKPAERPMDPVVSVLTKYKLHTDGSIAAVIGTEEQRRRFSSQPHKWRKHAFNQII